MMDTDKIKLIVDLTKAKVEILNLCEFQWLNPTQTEEGLRYLAIEDDEGWQLSDLIFDSPDQAKAAIVGKEWGYTPETVLTYELVEVHKYPAPHPFRAAAPEDANCSFNIEEMINSLANEAVNSMGEIFWDQHDYADEGHPEPAEVARKAIEVTLRKALFESSTVARQQRCGNPACDSNDVEGGFCKIIGNKAYQNCSCAECNSEWTDVYQRVGVTNLNLESNND